MNLQQLTKTPDAERDQKWEDQFLQALSESNLRLLSQDPQQGPDNWPYLLAETTGECNESAQKVLHWLATRGVGLAINPQKEYPDFILSYGMVWSFRETGKFIHRQPASASIPKTEKVDFKVGELKQMGAPTLAYLPEYVRIILRDFFRDQGVLQAKVLVVSQDAKNYDLALSLESLGNPPEKEWAGIGEAISWFLPPHYSILLISEAKLPGFVTL